MYNLSINNNSSTYEDKMTYPTSRYSASPDNTVSRSSSGSPPSSSPHLVDHGKYSKKKLYDLFLEAKSSIERELAACFTNDQLIGKYKGATVNRFLNELPLLLSVGSQPVGIAFEPGTKNVYADGMRVELLPYAHNPNKKTFCTLTNTEFLEARFPESGLDLKSVYTFTPNYVRSIGQIQNLFHHANLYPSEWEAMLLLAESVGTFGNEVFVKEFLVFALDFAHNFLFTRETLKEQRGAILTMHRLLSPLVSKQLDLENKWPSEPILDFAHKVIIGLIKSEHQSRSLIKYSFAILFLKEFEKLDLKENPEWVKACVDTLKTEWTNDTRAIKDLIEALEQEKQSLLVSSMKVALERCIKKPLLSPSIKPYIPKDALIFLSRDSSSPEQEMAIPIVPIKEASPPPSSAFDEESLLLSFEEEEEPIFHFSELMKMNREIEKARSTGPSPAMDEESLSSSPEQKPSSPEVKEKGIKTVKAVGAAPQHSAAAADPLTKIDRYLKTSRLVTNHTILNQLLEAVSQMKTLDVSTWEKVIETVSKSKFNVLKERLWKLWTVADKGGMALDKVSHLWRKTKPLMNGLDPKFILDFFFGPEFLAMLQLLKQEKDPAQLNKYYSDVFAKAARQGDPETLLGTYCGHIREIESLDTSSLFKTDILQLIEKLSMKGNAPYKLILRILQDHAEQLNEASVCNTVLRVAGALLKRDYPFSAEEEEVLFGMVYVSTIHPSLDKRKIVETLSGKGFESHSYMLIKFIPDVINAVLDDKRTKEIDKKNQLNKLLPILEIALEKAAGIDYFPTRKEMLRTVERVEDFMFNTLKKRGENKKEIEKAENFIMESMSRLRCPMFRLEIETADPDQWDFQGLGQLWKKLHPGDQHDLAKILIERTLELPNGNDAEERILQRCLNLIDRVFISTRKEIVNRKIEVKTDNVWSVQLLDECFLRTEREIPAGDAKRMKESPEALLLRQTYSRIALRLLDRPYYLNLFDDAETLEMVMRWTIWTLFEKNGEGGIPLVEALNDSSMDSLSNVLRRLYGSDDTSWIIECITDQDPDALETIGESLLLMVDHLVEKAVGLLQGYSTGLYTQKQGVGYTPDRIKIAISDLNEAIDSVWDMTEADTPYGLDYQVWGISFDAYLELNNIYESFKAHFPEKVKGGIIAEIREIYRVLVQNVETKILSEISFWNKTDKKAKLSDLLEIYDAATLCKEAAISALDAADKNQSINHTNMINVVYEMARMAMYSMSDAGEKKALLGRVMDYVYRHLPFDDLENPIYGHLPSMHWTAEYEGVNSDYVPSRVIHPTMAIRQINSETVVDFTEKPDLIRAAVQNLATGLLNKETVRGNLILLKALDNTNLECFFEGSHAITLAMFVDRALKKFEQKLENPGIIEELKRFNVINLINNVVLYAIFPNNNFSVEWLARKLPFKGIAALTGTEDPAVNQRYETHLKSVARFLLELYIAFLKPNKLAGEPVTEEVLKELCVFAKLLKSAEIIKPEQILDLDDKNVTDKLDNLGLRATMEYHLVDEGQNKNLLAALISFADSKSR